jgi:predicted acylesterase/phospholipase RssA
MQRLFYSALIGLLCLSLAGCGSSPRKPAMSDLNIQAAQIDGLSEIRFVPSTKAGIDAYMRELKIIVPKRGHDESRASNYLSLSGGGDNGAFGAGLLSGWSRQGSRPEFDQVVGISTGALVAPFAFLGTAYDERLKTVFTTTTPADIYKDRNLISVLMGESLADNTPLFHLIRKTIDADTLEHIAAEYEQKGRLLLLGTTNIDTGQLVIWNMGKIASLRTETAASLFHRIMLASAAVPGVFPPELFEATLDGKAYHELHVDGGLSVQIYLYPAAVSKAAQESGIVKPRKRQAYIIRNARISVEQTNTEVSSLGVLSKSYKKILQAQGVGNLYQIYQIANRDKVGFNLAFIGDDFNAPHPTEFDQEYMQALYDYGFNKALAGYPWGKSPPGFDQSTREDIDALSQQPKAKP